MGCCCWFKSTLITAGVFIGTFEGDDIRTHHKRFLNMAIILLQRLPNYLSRAEYRALNLQARYWFKTTLISAGLFIGEFGGDNIRTHHQQLLKITIILLQPHRLLDSAFNDRRFVWGTPRFSRALEKLYLTELTRSVKFSHRVDR